MSLGDPVLETRLARAMLVGVRAMVLLTVEDDRALTLAEALAQRLAWPLRTWSVASGVDRGGRERELGGLLARLSSSDDEAVWLLFDAGRELRGSAQRRLLRELAQSTRGPAVLLVESDPAAIPDIPELEIEALPLPDLDQLRERVVWIATEIRPDRPALADTLSDAAERIAAAGLGFALERFDRLVAEAILSDAASPASVAAALERRRIADACGPWLERVEPADPSALVGYARYLSWLRERALSLDPNARRAGLPRPRGVGLVGMPGCDRRLAARVGAAQLGLALVRPSCAASFASDAPRSTIAALERAAPVALLLDDGDPPELLVALARWLSARERDVFTFVIGSEPERLPPPWRSGESLDTMFFIDLPGPERRAELLAKLLPKASRPTTPPDDRQAQLLELARAAEGCSPDDLADALTRARLRSFARGRALAADELEAALAEAHPTGRREAARLARLREWAKLHAQVADAWPEDSL